MPLYKVTLTAQTEYDVWYEADDAAHAEQLAYQNDPESYDRVRSAVSIGTGSIRPDNATIVINNVELVE